MEIASSPKRIEILNMITDYGLPITAFSQALRVKMGRSQKTASYIGRYDLYEPRIPS